MAGLEAQVRTKRIILVVAIVIITMAALLAITVTKNSGEVAMSTMPLSDDAIYYGVFTIPNAGIETELYRFYDGCSCCFFGLYNGGRIISSGKEDWDCINVGDYAYIKSEELGKTVFELAEIIDCINVSEALIGLRGLIESNGDVLLCVYDNNSPVVRVYRWIML